MRRSRKKAISIVVTLAFLLTTLFGFAGTAAAATYCEFAGGYTDVIADDGQKGGVAEVRQSVVNEVYQWAKAQVDTVLVSVTLPDGVEYSEDPVDDSSETNYYYENYVTVNNQNTPPAFVEFVSGSSDYLEIKLVDNAKNFDDMPISVEFKFGSINIDPDFTGDVKVLVEAVGLANGTVKFRESEYITIARVLGSDAISITAGDPEVVAIGSGRAAAKITVAEGKAGALYLADDVDGAIELEILTSGVVFDDVGVKGIRFNDDSVQIKFYDESTVAKVYGLDTGIEGLPGKVEITPYLAVSPEATGDIKIKVTAYKDNNDSKGSAVSKTLTVAKAISKATFTVSDVKNNGGKVYAGYGATVLEENDKQAELKIKPVGAASFPTDTYIYVDIVGAKFAKDTKSNINGFSAGAEVDVKLYNDNKSAWFAVGGEKDVTLSNFLVEVAPDAAEGDIVLKLSSNVGSFDVDEVVIGKAVKPITVTVSSVPEVPIAAKGAAAGSITIAEAKDGAILPEGLKLTLPDGVKFSGKPDVEVTEGNLDVEVDLADDDESLVLKVTKKSAEASTIEITGIEYDITRLAFEGDVKVKVTGYDDEDTKDGAEWADTKKALAEVVNAKVVSATKRTGVFTLGSNVYTINGVEYTMDVAAYEKNGRTYLPVRYVAYVLGVDPENVYWNQATRTVTLVKNLNSVQLTIGSKEVRLNGNPIPMDVAPEIQNGRTMLPIRFIAQAFGASVTYDEVAKTITISLQ